jgi:hypothetical protein
VRGGGERREVGGDLAAAGFEQVVEERDGCGCPLGGGFVAGEEFEHGGEQVVGFGDERLGDEGVFGTEVVRDRSQVRGRSSGDLSDGDGREAEVVDRVAGCSDEPISGSHVRCHGHMIHTYE